MLSNQDDNHANYFSPKGARRRRLDADDGRFLAQKRRASPSLQPSLRI
jgi:hypothetical protein